VDGVRLVDRIASPVARQLDHLVFVVCPHDELFELEGQQRLRAAGVRHALGDLA
jgi:hypothetical protein